MTLDEEIQKEALDAWNEFMSANWGFDGWAFSREHLALAFANGFKQGWFRKYLKDNPIPIAETK